MTEASIWRAGRIAAVEIGLNALRLALMGEWKPILKEVRD